MIMNKDTQKKNKQQSAVTTHKRDKNSGSGSFNQGSEQDPNYDEGTQVSDEEKKTGHSPSNLGKQRENPKDGNIGKNNAGGYK